MSDEFWYWFTEYAYPRLGQRSDTFKKIFEHLDKFKNPVIIETGIADIDDPLWSGHGASTILFDKYVSIRNGKFYTVDISYSKISKVGFDKLGKNTFVQWNDSLKFLADYVHDDSLPFPHVVYLDSYDYNPKKPLESQVHHYNELQKILPKITEDTLVVVDDSPYLINQDAINGKGYLIDQYAKQYGVELIFSDFQAAWMGFNKIPDKDLPDLVDCGFTAFHLGKKGKHEEAIPLYERVLNYIQYDTSIFRYYYALSLFAIGRLKEGWQNLLLSRIGNDTHELLYKPIQRFGGEKHLFIRQPPPATLLITTDGGEGDVFALVRYLPLLVERGYKVIFEARHPAVKIFEDSFKTVKVIPKSYDPISNFDYYLPITLLPFVFQTDMDSIPLNGAYIKTDPVLVKKYEKYKDKIGICWSTPAGAKTVPFDQLKPIIDTDPSRFVAVQAGEARLDNNLIEDVLPNDEGSLTWADTAALIENLRLVLAIDTSVAHLAGAMNKPTWLMMHYRPIGWQVLHERPGSKWNGRSHLYPNTRIFRQREAGNWDHVIKDIEFELRNS